MAVTVVADTAAPVTSASAATGPMILTPADGAGSGVADTLYCVDSSNTCVPSTSGITVNPSCPGGVGPCSLYIRYYSVDRVGNKEATKSSSVIFPLAVSKFGSAADKVESSVGGISCGATCQANFQPYQQLTLTAVPAADSVFLGWSGNCVGNQTVCDIVMTGGKNVDANFDACGNATVRVDGSSYYNSIRAAYNQGGNTAELDLRSASEYVVDAAIFTNPDKTITLNGGFDCLFMSTGGPSIILGPLTITEGSVTVDNISIK